MDEKIVEITLKEYAYLEWFKQNNGVINLVCSRSRIRIIEETAFILKRHGLIDYDKIEIKEIEEYKKYFFVTIELKNFRYNNYKILDTLENKIKLKIEQ